MWLVVTNGKRIEGVAGTRFGGLASLDDHTTEVVAEIGIKWWHVVSLACP